MRVIDARFSAYARCGASVQMLTCHKYLLTHLYMKFSGCLLIIFNTVVKQRFNTNPHIKTITMVQFALVVSFLPFIHAAC